jgi:crotonobetainyl-CoA:carnitine CoA-transferase CaiB-like acyl-CoA transferase
VAGPLSHIRVLDMSRIMAGPWASQLLADLGADVVKVERPKVGDDTRSWGPPFFSDRAGKPTKQSGYFLAVNRGKRSITINLDKAEGQKVIRDLARKSDICIENFKVGTLARYGLGYADLSKINPRLIYCSITGFGQDGPRRDEAAYDFAVQAMGGLMSVTGEAEGKPGGGPQKVGVPIVDLMTGMYAAVAVLAALANRERTGKGDYIDLAMLDVSVGFLANQAMNYLVSGRPPRRSGNAHPNIQPQDVYTCRDGQLVLAVGNDGQFRALVGTLGNPAWGAEERFATNAGRVVHRDDLKVLINASLASRDLGDWIALFSDKGIPCAPINSVPMAFDDAQVKHRKILRRISHPGLGDVPQVVSPFVFKKAALSFDRAPPLLGEHTDEVLAELRPKAKKRPAKARKVKTVKTKSRRKVS